jgi:hypothetical protein
VDFQSRISANHATAMPVRIEDSVTRFIERSSQSQENGSQAAPDANAVAGERT